jgi:hypothetical protein
MYELLAEPALTFQVLPVVEFQNLHSVFHSEAR